MWYYAQVSNQPTRNNMNTFTKAAIRVQQSMKYEALEEERAAQIAKNKEFFIRENNKRDQMVRNGLVYTG
jgi:hypothetical protein